MEEQSTNHENSKGSVLEDDYIRHAAQSASAAAWSSCRLSPAQLKSLASVKIELGIEIGTLHISAAELIELLPGQICEYESGPLAEFVVRLGGEQAATARFISTESGLGLEILSIAGNN